MALWTRVELQAQQKQGTVCVSQVSRSLSSQICQNLRSAVPEPASVPGPLTAASYQGLGCSSPCVWLQEVKVPGPRVPKGINAPGQLQRISRGWRVLWVPSAHLWAPVRYSPRTQILQHVVRFCKLEGGNSEPGAPGDVGLNQINPSLSQDFPALSSN